jgi:hypothetical protein
MSTTGFTAPSIQRTYSVYSSDGKITLITEGFQPNKSIGPTEKSTISPEVMRPDFSMAQSREQPVILPDIGVVRDERPWVYINE